MILFLRHFYWQFLNRGLPHRNRISPNAVIGRACPLSTEIFSGKPITDYTYNGYQEKSSYKNSNVIFITYKSKQYTLHTGDRILDKIKSGNFPNLYYFSKADYLFFEGDYLPVGYAKAALLFTILFPVIGTLIWRKELDNDIRTM